ncbi:multidrug resistance-associated protein 1-like isoform X5 [Ruditapes philippinarum]|uniref:multidrug resistance-associated protein 1-like isoform X5 n=1 Tax=Ruditapes philippinarum TaxID=129788 RepID=UPI00295B1CF1|nr:multidrug resistance-associated protein 1-like isoform X5 [Ruditapes philippinarum]
MFCDPSEEFLNENQYWNTTDPDFSECFQKTVLLWIPCGFLLLLAPARILILHNSDHKHIIPWSWRSRTKLGLAFVIALLGALDIGYSIYEHFNGTTVPVVDFLSPLVLVLTMIVYVLVIHFERKNSVRSSGFLFNFWFIMFLVSIVTFRSKIRVALLKDEVEDMFRFVTFYIFFAVILVQLIISTLVDKQPVGAVPVEDENPCPEPHVSFLSQVTFWWFSSLVVLGYKRPLEKTDLWNLNPSDKCKNVMPKFDKHLQKELNRCRRVHESLSPATETNAKEVEMKEMPREDSTPKVQIQCEKKKPRLFWAMMKTFWFKSFIAAVYKLIFDVLQFVSPLILKYLIAYTTDKKQETWKGYWYASLMLAVVLFQSVVLHQYFQNCTVVGMRLRTAIIGAVYEKMLRLSTAARRTSTVGEIVNLMSVDAQRFNDMMTYINMIWSGPVQITISIYFLWVTLGPSILAGLAVMIILIPVNAVIANKVKQFQVQQMNLKDKRIKMMNEILSGIKVLKLYAWEASFEQKVLDIRNKELAVLKKMSYLNACTTFTWTVAPVAVCLVTFAVYVMVDVNNILDAEKAFVSLSLFNILRFPLSMLPMVISNIVQVRVSLTRLRNFLGNDELDPDAVSRDPNSKYAFSIKNGCFSWDSAAGTTLKNINLEVPEGSLIAVVGTVGTGKSSLLQAMLGEMEKLRGDVTIKGSIAYVSQQAWIQNATLQDNILFGKSADVSQYRNVIEACALQPDLEIMPAGDQTEIGEKGINLSGGQKQRVSLARAVYQDRDLYLLDDPLSAVDSHVGKHIFENVIGPDGLLKGKTRVLVTHGVGFLPYVDTIVVLADGQISEIGSYKQLLDHDGAFAQFLKNYLTEELQKENAEDMELDVETISQIETFVGQSAALQRQVSVLSERMRNISEAVSTPPGTPDISRKGATPGSPNLNKNASGSKTHLTSQKSLHEVGNGIDKKAGNKKDEEKKLIEAEKMETDRVKLGVFAAYVKSVGVLLSVLTVVFYILYNAANLYSNIWLSEWSNDVTHYNMSANFTVDTAQRDMRLGIYGLLGFIQGVLTIAASISLYNGVLKAARNLHLGILYNIMRSPMSFFDTTPSGRILNRFGKDVDVLDNVLAFIIRGTIMCFLGVICVPIVIGMSTPLFLTTLIPLGIFYMIVQRFYVATSRQLKRLESVSRSPIYSHFGETVTGVTTVRAYRQQERFIETSDNKVDDNLECHYPTIISNRWLAIRLEFVGNCILFFAALFAVIARNDLSPGIVGLSITYALNVTQTLNWMVRMTTELETNIVAVERVKEYSETPTEAAWEVEDKRPSENWPEKGEVKFVDYGTRYREGLDLVIKGIDCTVKPGEKVGIVGRTGAGKSSLTLALFRIIEPAQGHIIIDGVNIGEIGLHDLRSKLTIIPQEPVLFSGTLRMNLDPFDEHTDDAVWTALEHAHLKAFVAELPTKLEHECTEGGENLSVGQRQLVCLARALLRKTKILILDEATAAVDLETDDLIQHTIRTEFSDATVLTIAHRLNTIMDYTRVMVLDQGKIKEFQSPQELLQDKDSIFYGMAADAGLV